jgi:hypothetical protein
VPALTVIVPWRAAPSREGAFAAVRAWYAEHLPEATILPVDCADEVFNLSQARNTGINAIADPNEVVVINDADTLPQPDALRHAIAAAASDSLVHLPYTEYHWLGASGSAQFAEGTPLDDCDFELVRGACSGIYVTTPATWWLHGGQDERFRGWGFEDAAWYVAHETLLGEPPARHAGRVYALHHAPERRDGPHYDANAALMERYRAAARDPDAMRQIVADSASAARTIS